MIAIVIPTINRSKFLARALDFYARKDFDGLIYIGDSSSDSERKKNEALVNKFDSKLNVYYYYFDGHHDGEVVQKVNTHILRSVKYVTFSGDDDFHVPEGLAKCAEFLDNNPDYIACHGHRINFCYTTEKVKLLNVRYGYNWDDSFTQIDRLVEYLRTGIALSGYLHRRETWIERYKIANTIPTRYLGGELCQECTTALLGKVKFLKDVVSFLFFQDNPERIFSFDSTFLFDLMNTENWYISYNRLLDRLTSLMEVPDRSLMNRQLYLHIISVLSTQYTSKFGAPPTDIKMSQNECDLGALSKEIGNLLNLVGQIRHEQRI